MTDPATRAETFRWTLFPAKDFPRFAGDWRSLNDRSTNSPTLDPAYVGPLIEIMGSGRELLAVCRDSSGVQAMTILVHGKMGSWYSFQAAGCPFGAWVKNPALPLDRALRSLLRALPGFAVLISVNRQDPDIVPRPADRGYIRTLDYMTTARIAKLGTFDDLLRSRGKNLRHNMKRLRNRLTKMGIAPRLELITHSVAMDAVIDQYGVMESAGWKAREGNNIHPENSQGRFFKSMTRNLAAQGEARAYRYWYGDKLVAMNLYVHRAGVFYLLRTTYDESEKATSPGAQLHRDAFRALFDEPEFKAIEFYGEYVSWEAKWTNENRMSYHVNYYRWPALAVLHNQARGRKWRLAGC